MFVFSGDNTVLMFLLGLGKDNPWLELGNDHVWLKLPGLVTINMAGDIPTSCE